ncbi:MAG TPA: AAA family ATPase [Baekduia sp.]
MTPLVGRDSELSALESWLGSAADAGGSLLVRGAPGIGKSALLDVARTRWSERGRRTLRTDGTPAEVRLPFAGVHKLLRPLGAEIRRLPAAHRDALERALAMADAPAEQQMFRVAQAALDLFADVARDQPLLLVVDDTHWLDPSSAGVLAFVARRLVSEPILLLASARTADDPLAAACEGELTLGPLAREQALQLLTHSGRSLGPRLRSTVLEAAAGNPLALVELPKVVGQDTMAGGTLRLLPMTERLERSFAVRASELDGATGDLLLVAAINDSDSVAEAVGAASLLRGEPVDVDDLAPAAAAGLIEMGWQTLRFRHPLMRSAVYQAASWRRRREGHAALARVLEREDERRAWHQAEATIGTDATVASALEVAATRAMRRGASAEAVVGFERSARMSASAPDRARRLLRAAEVGADRGDAALCARVLDELGGYDLAPLDRLRVAWLLEKLDGPMTGGPQRIDALLGLVRRARQDGHVELALGFLERAALRCWTVEPDAEVARRVAGAADRLGATPPDPRVVVARAYASPFEAGADVIEVLGDPELAAGLSGSGLHLLGHAAATVGAFPLARSLLIAATDRLREDGRLLSLAQAQRILGWSQLRIGLWDAAGLSAGEARLLAEETRQPLVIADSLSIQAMLAGLRGRGDEADRLAASSEQVAASAGFTVTLATLQSGRAARAAGAGDSEAAFHELHRIYEVSHPAYHRMQGCWALGSLAEYAVWSGNEEAARRALAELEPLATLTPAPAVQMSLRHARAVLGTGDDVERLFEAALDPSLGEWPFETARVRLAYGAFLRRARRVADSRQPLRAARDAFDRLGAVGWAQRARDELRAAGETNTRRPADAWDQLTTQEMQIAQMAAEGLSNKEIGRRLYLSHRTVASHLYRVFPKLGIASRAELAGIVGAPPAGDRR